MTFVRPELRAGLWRARDIVAALVLAGCGLWIAGTSFGVTQWIGWALAALGALLGWTAVQRLRFGRGGGGIGVVQVDERRIAYFGPLTGGIADLDDLQSLDLDGSGHPAAHWILTSPGGGSVAIPVDAEGAEALFDAFTGLPGLNPADLVAALNGSGTGRQTVWQRNPRRLH